MPWNSYYQRLHKPTRKSENGHQRGQHRNDGPSINFTHRHMYMYSCNHNKPKCTDSLAPRVPRCHRYDISDDMEQVCDKVRRELRGSMSAMSQHALHKHNQHVTTNQRTAIIVPIWGYLHGTMGPLSDHLSTKLRRLSLPSRFSHVRELLDPWTPVVSNLGISAVPCCALERHQQASLNRLRCNVWSGSADDSKPYHG